MSFEKQTTDQESDQLFQEELIIMEQRQHQALKNAKQSLLSLNCMYSPSFKQGLPTVSTRDIMPEGEEFYNFDFESIKDDVCNTYKDNKKIWSLDPPDSEVDADKT